MMEMEMEMESGIYGNQSSPTGRAHQLEVGVEDAVHE
jgi:hypothetical protein